MGSLQTLLDVFTFQYGYSKTYFLRFEKNRPFSFTFQYGYSKTSYEAIHGEVNNLFTFQYGYSKTSIFKMSLYSIIDLHSNMVIVKLILR